MTEVTFTGEHLNKLKQLSIGMLFEDRKIKGQIGTELSIHDLLHNSSVATLQKVHGNLKKAIENKEGLDEWSMTPYQQRQLETLNKDKEIVNLIIGYKKFLAQQESNKSKLSEIREEIAQLKKATMSPEDRIAALTLKEQELAGLSEGFTEEVNAIKEEIKSTTPTTVV